jgi:two-component system, cell cycle sensor histidine kinase and response regulator CckA
MENRRMRVLLIEDDLEDVKLLREALSEVPSVPLAMVHAGKLADGLAQLEQQNFDVVLLDLSLPDIDGLETLFRLFEEQPAVPVVVLSGRDDDAIALEAVHRGAQDYLVKGQSDGQLVVRAMRYAVERHSAAQEHQRLETQLQQCRRLESLGVLAGGVAHDFNNLLTGILGYSSLALVELWPDSAACRYVRQIERAARRATELTGQMLAYAGRGKFVTRPLELAELLEQMRPALVEAVAERAELALVCDGPVWIEGDPAQIEQLLQNLVRNAAEAVSPPGGKVCVRLGRMRTAASELTDGYVLPGLAGGDYASLQVTDTGAGMDPETLERAFEPFFSTRFAGRGLGLPASLGIVRGHRGTIRIDSAPEAGTRVTVLLPLGDAPSQLAAADEAPASQTEHPSVLVVDDEDYVRAMSRRILEKAGFLVQTARDGRDALRRFQEPGSHFDLVLLDMTMPGMSGEEVLTELLKLRPAQRVMLCSGYARPEALERIAVEATTDFLRKPYSPPELVSRLRSLLSRQPELP